METANPRCLCGRLWEPDERYCAGCGKARNDPIQNDPSAAARKSELKITKRDRRGGPAAARRSEDWASSRREDYDRPNKRAPPPPEGLKCGQCGRLWVPPSSTCECGSSMFSKVPQSASELDDERAAEAEAEAAREELEAAEQRRREAAEARRAAESVLANPNSTQSHVNTLASFSQTITPNHSSSSSSSSSFSPPSESTTTQDSKPIDHARVAASLAALSTPGPRTLPSITSRGRVEPSSYDRPPRYPPRNTDAPRRSPDPSPLDHTASPSDRGIRGFPSSSRPPSVDRPMSRSYANRSYDGPPPRNEERFYEGPAEPRANPREFQSHAQLKEHTQLQPRGIADRQTSTQLHQPSYDRYSDPQAEQRHVSQRSVYDRGLSQSQLADSADGASGYAQAENYHQPHSERQQQSQTQFSHQPTSRSQEPPYSQTQSYGQPQSAQYGQHSQYGQTPAVHLYAQGQHGTSAQYEQQAPQHGQSQNGQSQNGAQYEKTQYQSQSYGQSKHVEPEPTEADVWADLPVYTA